MGVRMGIKFMEVSKNLGGETNKTFVAAKLMGIVMIIELIFCCKDLMTGFTLKRII